MKKLIALLFVIVLIFAMTACGSNTDNSSASDVNTDVSSGDSAITSNGNSTVNSVVGNSTVNSSVGNSQVVSNESGASVELPSNGETIASGEVKIISSYGGQETAYVTWEIGSADGYIVYYKGSNITNWTKIDNELIRKYPSCYRADVLGLKSGEYNIKVVPVASGVERDSASSTVKVSVIAHAREGFAFSASSPNKTASGAYKDNGTLKSDAKVLYVTKDNFNTVALDVVKDGKGTTVKATGVLDILYYFGKGYDTTPLSIRIIGTVSDSDIVWATSLVQASEFNYVELKKCSDLTFEGVGSDATCSGWSVKVREANNVEVRNLAFMLFKDDGVTIDTNNNNIWIHNNDFFYGAPGSDADQVKGDGSCDNKKTNYLTVSYNHFWDSGKAILCGMGDTMEYFATFHHNWFDHSDSRHPRIRVGTIHVYNNYYDGVSKYGIGATTGSSCFAESNYFLNTQKPMLISMQGTDVAGGKGNFSGETGGIIKSYGNIFDKTKSPVDYSSNNTGFDCYTVSNKKDTVPSNVKTLSGGTTYNNFDTSSAMYSYNPHSASDVPAVVKSYAGRVGGGDFVWTFTDADNADYGLNAQLKNAITSYKSSLVSVGGLN